MQESLRVSLQSNTDIDGNGRIPPKQRPYDIAYELAFDKLVSDPPSASILCALGASIEGELISLPVLGHRFIVDMAKREVTLASGGRPRIGWSLLVLHYLCAEYVSHDARQVTLNHFASCRGYLDVFAKRIIGRFLHTVGRAEAQFIEASERLGGTRAFGPGVGYRFEVLPRVPIAIVRYEGDEEIAPGANVIYPADAEHLLPAEDCVVIAELLLDTLSGKPIEEQPGGGL